MRRIGVFLALLVLCGCVRQELPELSEPERLEAEIHALEVAIASDRRVLERNDENRLPWTSIRAELDTYHKERERRRNDLHATLLERIYAREKALAARSLAFEEAVARIDRNGKARQRLEGQLKAMRLTIHEPAGE